MILLSEVEQALQQPFVKQNTPKSSFHQVSETHWTIEFYILSRYTLLPPTLTRSVLFEGGLPDVL